MPELNFQVEVFEEPSTLVANPDHGQTNATVPTTVDVLANDTLDGEPVTIGDLSGPPTITTAPANGEATVDADTGAVTYTPEAGFCGVEVFGYEILAEPPAPEIELNLNTVCDAEFIYGDAQDHLFYWTEAGTGDPIAAPDWYDPETSFILEWADGQGTYVYDSIQESYEVQPGYTGTIPPCCDQAELTMHQGDNSVRAWLNFNCA